MAASKRTTKKAEPEVDEALELVPPQDVDPDYYYEDPDYDPTNDEVDPTEPGREPEIPEEGQA